MSTILIPLVFSGVKPTDCFHQNQKHSLPCKDYKLSRGAQLINVARINKGFNVKRYPTHKPLQHKGEVFSHFPF